MNIQHPVWVKCKDRLPAPKIHFPLKLGNQFYGAFYSEEHKMIYSLNTHHYWSVTDVDTMIGIEWLDESGTTAIAQEVALLKEVNNEALKLTEKAQLKCQELKAKGDKLALALRRMSRSVQVHPDYDTHQEWQDYVSGAEEDLAEWSGEKEGLTQARADFIREANGRGINGIEAVEFAEWILIEGWKTSHNAKGWMKHSDETPNVLTTAELYELFKQQKEVKP